MHFKVKSFSFLSLSLSKLYKRFLQHWNNMNTQKEQKRGKKAHSDISLNNLITFREKNCWKLTVTVGLCALTSVLRRGCFRVIYQPRVITNILPSKCDFSSISLILSKTVKITPLIRKPHDWDHFTSVHDVSSHLVFFHPCASLDYKEKTLFFKNIYICCDFIKRRHSEHEYLGALSLKITPDQMKAKQIKK